MLAAVQVAELAVQRRHDRLRQQVRGDDPREVLEAAEVADDRRQRRRDDRLIERGEQHHEHEAREDDVDVARAAGRAPSGSTAGAVAGSGILRLALGMAAAALLHEPLHRCVVFRRGERRPRQGGGAAGAQAVDEQREVALPELRLDVPVASTTRPVVQSRTEMSS